MTDLLWDFGEFPASSTGPPDRAIWPLIAVSHPRPRATPRSLTAHAPIQEFVK
jgi:hypothetical protein